MSEGEVGEVAELVRIIRKVAKNSGVRLHDVFVGRLAEAIVASAEFCKPTLAPRTTEA